MTDDRTTAELDEMATYFAKSSVTISQYLIGHVRRLYEVSLRAAVGGSSPAAPGATETVYELRRTELAIPAYILSTAAVEAFVNEVFLSDFSAMVFDPSPLSNDSGLLHVTESLERLDLPTKLNLIPRLVIGRALEPGSNPYQDMVLLTRLRNELVHYKMDSKPPGPVKVLSQRGIAFRVSPEEEAGGPHPWAERVSTLQGIRWACNTACATVAGILSLVPTDQHRPLEGFRNNFRPIP